MQFLGSYGWPNIPHGPTKSSPTYGMQKKYCHTRAALQSRLEPTPILGNEQD